jgi:hypothetical protein
LYLGDKKFSKLNNIKGMSKRDFTKEEVQIAKKHMKKAQPLVTRESKFKSQ